MSEMLKHMVVGTVAESPLRWLRLAAKVPWRLRNPELHEIFMEPLRFDRALTHTLASNSNFVDVGAHLGGVLSIATRIARNGTHWAFEPIDQKASWLRAKFPGVNVSELAITDSSGPQTFYKNQNQTAMSGLLSARGTNASTREIEIRVQCDTLDSCLPADYSVDVLKIDVTGAELGVLRGATKVIERSKPIVFFASGSKKLARFGSTPEAIYDWFNARNYSVFFLKDFISGAPSTDRERFLAGHQSPFQGFNFVARPLEEAHAHHR